MSFQMVGQTGGDTSIVIIHIVSLQTIKIMFGPKKAGIYVTS